MSSGNPAVAGEAGPDVWRALASRWRRRLLERLRTAAAGLPELSRFAVMQHLAMLAEAGLVLPDAAGGTASTTSTVADE
jgi:hypothetical protein